MQAHVLSTTWRRGFWLLVATTLPPLGVAVGCHHDGSSSDGMPPDEACTASPTLPAVQELFTSRCAGSSCHGSGPSAMFPPLAEGDPSAWLGLSSHEQPGMQLVVPGHPEQSYLYMKVSGTQGPGGGALMPLGAATPIPEAAAVHDWIAAGAPGSCAGDDAGAPAVNTDPNTLDQAQLFTCPMGSPPASSPGRIRRIDSSEWTHALPKPLNGALAGTLDPAFMNPFVALPTQAYSTYSAGITIDTPTLDLYFQVLPEGPESWVAANPTPEHGLHLAGINSDGALDCMFGAPPTLEVSPTDACINAFVDRFLTVGVLARAPTAAEHANLRAFFKTALAAEGGDVTLRSATISLVGQAAWLTSGALFRTEIGSPAANDPAHRNQLGNEEMALAVGSMLFFHRPGTAMIAGLAPPDPDDECDPWLHLVSQAAADGSIQDPATIKKLIAAYGGGVDPGGAPLACATGTTPRRRDLDLELGNATVVGPRGEYWLAPRISGFFREWLGYGTASSVFKENPGLTSKYTTTTSVYDWTTAGFDSFQAGAHYEGNIVAQLDDTIARAVIEAANDHMDVFKALMTTRTWHVPSDRVDTGKACTSNADCAAPYGSCVTPPGLCVDSTAGGTLYQARAFNVDGVPPTDDGRWVEMPATERSGVLTHPAWLAAFGDNDQDDPSLVHRGKWVRENLFCETVPGLELVMVAARVGPSEPHLSARDRVEAAINPNATCMGCHHLMNPLGYPFEMYNHAGFLRTWDKLGAHGDRRHLPDATSSITDAPDPALNAAVTNAIDFTQRLADSPYARRCFIRQAFRYFMGRDETLADQCTLTAMETALDTGSFFDMLGVLASSDTVTHRTQGGTP